MKNILISKPYVTFKDLDSVSRSVYYSWGDNKNYYSEKFEIGLKKYIGTKYCILTSSCTGATHLAFASIGLQKGDEVILPNITWFSCASVIKYFDAKPVFIDVDPQTLCIDTKKIEANITNKTKVILAVHLYGSVSNIEDLIKIKKKHRLFLIEDCAEAIGSLYKNKKVGSYGDISLFSFHGSKTISTGGEGGALLTNNKKIYEYALKLSNHGKNSKKLFYQDIIGFKYKMSELQAAMGVSQLSNLNYILKKKNKIFNFYKFKLKNLPIKFIESDKDSLPFYWMPTIIVLNKKFNKEKFIFFLKKKKINIRPVFYPLSSLPPYKNKVNKKKIANLANSILISKYGFNLPSYPELSDDNINYIISTVKEFFKKFKI